MREYEVYAVGWPEPAGISRPLGWRACLQLTVRLRRYTGARVWLRRKR